MRASSRSFLRGIVSGGHTHSSMHTQQIAELLTLRTDISAQRSRLALPRPVLEPTACAGQNVAAPQVQVHGDAKLLRTELLQVWLADTLQPDVSGVQHSPRGRRTNKGRLLPLVPHWLEPCSHLWGRGAYFADKLCERCHARLLGLGRSAGTLLAFGLRKKVHAVSLDCRLRPLGAGADKVNTRRGLCDAPPLCRGSPSLHASLPVGLPPWLWSWRGRPHRRRRGLTVTVPGGSEACWCWPRYQHYTCCC